MTDLSLDRKPTRIFKKFDFETNRRIIIGNRRDEAGQSYGLGVYFAREFLEDLLWLHGREVVRRLERLVIERIRFELDYQSRPYKRSQFEAITIVSAAEFLNIANTVAA